MVTGQNKLHHPDLTPYLLGCGYDKEQLVPNIELVNGHRFTVPLTAFAHNHHDTRSACIAVLENEAEIQFCRGLGAPLIFVWQQDQLLFFTQTVKGHRFEDNIPSTEVRNFFHSKKDYFSPETVYRAKTLGRFEKIYQLDFVDLGWMPLIEEESGRKLSELIERVVMMAKASLRWKEVSQTQGQWLLKSIFWLLAAKILKDKNVSAFAELNLEDLDEVYASVAKHYGSATSVQIPTREQRRALIESANEISTFSHCGLVSTEALAYLYERTLITQETRVELGTHSTPSYLVEYILGKLQPWIEKMPYHQREVFEPACGHAAFLVAAMRLLGALPPVNTYTPEERHQYLRHRLHGNDIDPFALEIARLSLTLADAPNPNGWDLHAVNMFKGNILSHGAHKADIILANPPFEDFKQADKDLLSVNPADTPKHVNKAAELLWRVVTEMRPGAVFGMVLPRGILHDKNAALLRQYIAINFEIKEILLLPDKIFPISEAESTIILGRRNQESKSHNISYGRIRQAEVKEFKQTYTIKQTKDIKSSQFLEADDFSFFVPDLEEIWGFCKDYPKFKDVADIGIGFQFHSKDKLPEGVITKSGTQQEGLVKGFARLGRDLRTHELPEVCWLNLDPSVISVSRDGTAQGISQVLLNHSRISRSPWRLKAFLDKDGHPVTQSFLVIRPKDCCWPLEALWGICNSPLANAYSYAFSTERHVLVNFMLNMPFPTIDANALTSLVDAVRNYFQAVEREYSVSLPVDQEKLKLLHWRIDAEVLSLYKLPQPLERQLLDLFLGERRRGVPFEQYEYFSKEYNEPLTLNELLMITTDWEQTNERRAQLIFKKVKKKDISTKEMQELEALQRLADCRIELLAPIPIQKLEAIKEDLERRGMWKQKH